jgi:hypothetical protein
MSGQGARRMISEMRDAYSVFVGKPRKKRQCGKLIIWKDNIKMV